MNNFKKSNGITLVALVVTILILIILAGVTLYQILNRDSIEYARYGAFVTNFRMMEENIIIYRASKEMENIGSKNLTTIEKLPLKDKVTMQEIKKKSSLEKKIKEMTGKPIKEVNLYWVDNNKVDGKIKIKYVYDIDNNQLYDYEGEKIFGKIWHTPNSGTVEGNAEENGEETMWDGWITMNLYYPANSTERKWRLSSEGEIRYDESTQWKDYTGPITVKLSDVDNIWIKYKIDGKEYIISSNGQVVVDITADSYYPNLVEKVKVQISYDFNSIEDTRVYRIGNGDWLKYDGEFYVTENELIEAKCMKIENTYDNDGNLIYTIDRWGSDSFYIRNIKQTSISENHEAPTLTRNAPINENEVANVTISDYPSDAKKVVYKINYGIEQEYDGNNITIQKYGTSIIAYYYDTTGKKSKMREIIINDTTPEGSNENAGTMFNPTSPGKTPIEGGNGSSGDGSGTGSSSGGSSGGGSNNVVVTSKVIIPKPIINCTPTAKTTTGVTIGITIPDNYTAREIYVKIGNNPYMKYNEDINLTYNTTIKAYYITDNGYKSKVATLIVNNIKYGDLPYIKITETPDETTKKYGLTSAEVDIITDGRNLEWSTNGIEYKKYTGTIDVTKNCRIYARATNSVGTRVEYYDITNIGTAAPEKSKILSVVITASPEPQITEYAEEVKVKITYDPLADNRYYSIGKDGVLQEYTGEFVVKENCTIYAYAVGGNSTGSTYKIIDCMGKIAEPVITVTPNNNIQTASDDVTINYDKTSTVKKYRINTGEWIDYISPFKVTENCIITAYSENDGGYEATSSYTVSNIIPSSQKMLIDLGDYYILKLNYPENSKGRQYKFEQAGESNEWKDYKECGILLIKNNSKYNEIESMDIVKIKNEYGEEIEFDGEYYLVQGSINEMMANLYMRWDRMNLSEPTIVLNTTEPTLKVTVSILYDTILESRQYRILQPNGEIGEWQEYTAPFEVDRNNTIIYAKGKDEAEVWSNMATKKITNIDEEAPIIELLADLDTAQQQVGIRIKVTDDTGVETIKYEQGIRGASYFTNNVGTQINNNSIFYVNENGYYTIFAKDKVGNTQTYVLEVTNIDNTAPNIIITDLSNTVGTETTISIDYGDSTVKKYKIGENGAWTNYTKEIALSAYTIISNKQYNEDLKTVTIYAQGQDSSGNEQIAKKLIYSLDVDMPATPVIDSKYGYGTIFADGVRQDGTTIITFDSRKDIKNYYSIDGTNWKVYTGKLELKSAGTVYAKSVKESGLTVTTSKTVSQPSNALSGIAYDTIDTNYVQFVKASKRLNVDESIWNKKIIVKMNIWAKAVGYNTRTYWIYGYKADGSLSYQWKYSKKTSAINQSYNLEITVPENTIYFIFGQSASAKNETTSSSRFRIYEIRPKYEPTIYGTANYSSITSSGVQYGYCDVNIEYHSTSVEKLYRIDDGEWLSYTNNVKVQVGKTIYAKAIDKSGNESGVSSYTANLPSGALEVSAYDDIDTSYVQFVKATKRINVDKSIWNKKIIVKMNIWASRIGYDTRTYWIYGYDENGTLTYQWKYSKKADAINASYNLEITVPENTKYFIFGQSASANNETTSDSRFTIYEIDVL